MDVIEFIFQNNLLLIHPRFSFILAATSDLVVQ